MKKLFRNYYWLILSLVFGFLFLVMVGLNWFSLKNTNKQNNFITPSIQPSINLICSNNNDCVIGIQAATCCSCPEAINKNLINTNGWELYEFGKDYSSQKIDCDGEVACKPCQMPQTPVCLSGSCVFP